MHFTVERKRLVKMIEAVQKKMPGQKRREKTLHLFACSARAFVSANGVTAGKEALVFEDGGCDLKLDLFLSILKTYADKPNITIQADERSLRLFTTTIPISNYSKTVVPPAEFVVGHVTDVGLGRINRNRPGNPSMQ
jgi:hypothetical protein